jgi:hypothetical protein
MAKRKTVSVEALTEQANYLLANDKHGPEHRFGVMALIETVLHDTGNYRGFRYLEISEVPKGCLPGINAGPAVSCTQKFEYTDTTRIRFY